MTKTRIQLKFHTKRKKKKEELSELEKKLLENEVPVKKKKKEEVIESNKTDEDSTPQSSPTKDVPQSLTFKLSNGKMVSTDRKPKASKLRRELLKGRLNSPTKKPLDFSSPDTNKKSEKHRDKDRDKDRDKEKKKHHKSSHGDSHSKDKRKDKETDLKKKKREGEDSHKKDNKDRSKDSHSKDKERSKDKDKSRHSESKKSSSSSSHDSKKLSEKDKKRKEERERERKKSSSSKDKRKSSSEKENSKSSKSSHDKSGWFPGGSDSEDSGDRLMVDENPKPRPASTTKPASLKLRLPQGPNGSSISDLLTASGYTHTPEADPADASTEREAIAGMLTMAGPRGLTSPAQASQGSTGSRRGSQDTAGSSASAGEEEERLMEDCYRDDEFVYPSFELSDDDEDYVAKPKKRSNKDDNYNPKSRLAMGVLSPSSGSRAPREGAQREAMAQSLANTKAKLQTQAQSNRKPMKKAAKPPAAPPPRTFEVTPLPGPSDALDNTDTHPTQPVNAFRPGIKRPVDPCAATSNPAVQKAKKPKKGLATVKQRLAKRLNMKKVVF